MAEERHITPEKQLLKLIEESKGGSAAAQKAAGVKRKGLGFLSVTSLVGALFGRFSFFKRTAKKKITKARKFSFSIALLNKVLFAVTAVLLSYLVSDIALSVIRTRQPANFAFQRDKSLTHEEKKISPFLKDSAFYLDRVSARDIFKAWEPPKQVKKTAAATPTAPAAESVFKDLSLVGISWSANPDIIIEDKKNKKTLFLHKGQVFGDNIRVQTIMKNKVILSHDGEEFELK